MLCSSKLNICFLDNIQAVKLPRKSDENASFDDVDATISGWGRLNYSKYFLIRNIKKYLLTS